MFKMQRRDNLFIYNFLYVRFRFHYLQLTPRLRLSYFPPGTFTVGVPCILLNRRDRPPTGDGQSISAGRTFRNLASSFALVTGERSFSSELVFLGVDEDIGLDDSS